MIAILESTSNEEKASFIVTEHIISLQILVLLSSKVEPSQHILSITMMGLWQSLL